MSAVSADGQRYNVGIQTEYEPRVSSASDSEKPYNYQPTVDEEKSVKLGKQLLRIAKNARAKYDSKWVAYYRMFRGDQWPEKRPAYRHSEVINLIFQTIQASSPLITDGNPRVNFIPVDPSDREFAEIMDELFVSDYDKFNWLMEIAEMALDGYIMGTGVAYMGYDDEALNNVGAVVFDSKDAIYCYPDPEAKDPDKATYFIYAEPKPLGWIKARYPDKAQYIKSDCDEFIKQRKADQSFAVRHPIDGYVTVDWEGMPDSDYAKGHALYIEIYMTPTFVTPDGHIDGEFHTDEQDNKQFKLKYPNGRKICFVGNVLLSDSEFPFDDKKIPFVTWKNYIDPRSFWGISETEQLAGPQMTFNKLVSFALDVLTLMGNPIWIVDSSAGVDVDNIYNRPGAVVEKNPGSEVRREAGVQLQPYVLQLIDRLKLWFDDIGGSNDITRGVTSQGVSAASAIEQLQSAAQTRTRQKMRNLDATFEQIGSRYISRVLQFYSAPRVARVTGKDGGQKYFRMEINNSDNGKFVRISRYDHNRMQWEQSRDIYVKDQLDVKATTGSSLPFAKAQNESRLFNLFDRGIIDAEEILRGIDYPNVEAIVDKMKQRQEAQQQTQQTK